MPRTVYRFIIWNAAAVITSIAVPMSPIASITSCVDRKKRSIGTQGYLRSLTSGPMTEVCEYLREELDRAHVLPAEELCPDIVSIGSEVEFRDEQTGKTQKVILVYPFDADIAHRRVSVLTPVGAALLGLSINQTISFRTRTGERRELTVLKVGRAD